MIDADGSPAAPAVLVTGGARRLGAAIVRALHADGMSVVIHYRRSADPADALAAELDAARPGSVRLLRADLAEGAAIPGLVDDAVAAFGRLDALVNNASTFFPTPLGSVSEADWENLVGTNLKAPFFLAQAARPHLARARGAIVNMADIHGQRPLAGHAVYSVAKAGLIMLTRALARDLGPEVRVNAIAPGPILWPETGLDDVARAAILAATALGRTGTPEEIAATVKFLIRDAGYVTGETVAVDGGRSLA